MNSAVIGCGSWGTALAIQLARGGSRVRAWDVVPELTKSIQQERRNLRYLPDIELPSNLEASDDLVHVLEDAELVVTVVPSQAMRAAMKGVGEHLPEGATICCASKGIEQGTLMTMDEVLRDVLPSSFHPRLTYLSGPSFAKEVALGQPTAVAMAGRDPEVTRFAAEALHGPRFRIYDTDDVIGVELGGALKNVVAIGCGVVDGMKLGLNARAGLITRGLAEITRLAVVRGANPLTLSGLAGIGDLVLTCTGDLSRNRRIGLGLGQGKKLEDIEAELGQVAEGVYTAKSAYDLGRRENVSMPITDEIYAMLYEDKPVANALWDLTHRVRKQEREHSWTGGDSGSTE